MRKQKGFSLIELLIVVAIILIIAAIAVPNLLRARMAANDSAAASTVRTISSAEVTFSTTYPTHGYAETNAILGGTGATCDVTGACLVDPIIGCAAAPCAKGGHQYWVTSSAAVNGVIPDYTVTGGALKILSTANKNFCANADAVVRGEVASPNTQIAGAVNATTCGTIATWSPITN